MIEALREVLPPVALVVLLVTAVLHPRARTEALAGALCAAAVLATGVLDRDAVRTEVDRLLPVVLFLIAILVVAECCRAAGVFTAIGGRLRRLGSADAVFAWTFVVAALVTVVLSLDATVVLLTPVALAAAAGSTARPLQAICVRLANSASLLLPVSNLTNLLAMPHLDLSFGRFALLMAPPFLFTLACEFAGIRWWFRRDLQRPADSGEKPGENPGEKPGPNPAIPVVPLITVTVMLAGFAAGSTIDLDPAWVAGAAAVVLGVRALALRELGPARIAASTQLGFALFVLALGLVVAALVRGPLGDLVADLVPSSDGLPALLGLALLGALLANLLNNLPATLVLVPLVAPLGAVPVLAALIGINLGSSLTWTGSLANLLWRRTVVASGGTVRTAEFHQLALAITPVATVGSVVLLWAWSGVV